MLSTWASLWGNLSGLLSTFKGGDYQSGSPVSQTPRHCTLCKPQCLGTPGDDHSFPIFLFAYIKVSAPVVPTLLPLL